MKLSVSLPEDDVEFVDEYSRRAGGTSRSAVLHRAIELLRATDLEDEYAAAWNEWYESGDAEFWEQTIGDGITDAAR